MSFGFAIDSVYKYTNTSIKCRQATTSTTTTTTTVFCEGHTVNNNNSQRRCKMAKTAATISKTGLFLA